MSKYLTARNLLCVIVAVAVLPALFLGDRVAAAVGFTPVRVVNPVTSPALTRDVDRAAERPFSKLLCLTSISGACNASGDFPALPSTFVVPGTTASGETVKRLVIEFVSGTCIGTGRATFVQLSSRPAGAFDNSDTGDNFTSNRLPLAVAQFLQAAGVNGAQALAQSTRIYLDPGSTVSTSFDTTAAGGIVCRPQLNGFLVVR